MKRCQHFDCRGVMVAEPANGWEYHRTLPGDVAISRPVRSAAPLEWVCMLCGRTPDGPVQPERELPPPIPLTGVCDNGHSRAVHGWYSKDERTVSGYARRCAKCGEQNAAASRIRNNERGGGWNGRALA